VSPEMLAQTQAPSLSIVVEDKRQP
jgi:hypothetical protein